MKLFFLVLSITAINSLPLQDGKVTDGRMKVIKPFEDNHLSAFNGKEEETKNEDNEEEFESLIIDHVGDDPLAGPVKIKEHPVEEVSELPHEEEVEKLTEKEFIEGEHDHEVVGKSIPESGETKETVSNEELNHEEETGDDKETIFTYPVTTKPEEETHEEETPSEEHENEEESPIENLNNEEFVSEEEEEGHGGETIFTYPIKTESEEESHEEEVPFSNEEEETKPYSEEKHEEETPAEEHVHEEETPVEEHVNEEETPVEEHVNEEETPIEEHRNEEETPVEEHGNEEETPGEEDVDSEEEIPVDEKIVPVETEETDDETGYVEWGDPNEEIPPPDFPKSLLGTPEEASKDNHDEEINEDVEREDDS